MIRETSKWANTAGTGRSLSNSDNIVQYGKSTPIDSYCSYIETFIKDELKNTPFINNLNKKEIYNPFVFINLKFGKNASTIDNENKNIHKRQLIVEVVTKNLIDHYEENNTIFKNKINNAIKGGIIKYNEVFSEKVKITDVTLYNIEINSNSIKLSYNITDELYSEQEKKPIVRLIKHNITQKSEAILVNNFLKLYYN